MDLIEKNGVPIFTFSELVSFDGLRHGIFTRKGGRSKTPFDSLNISFSVGDNTSNVKSNRAIISESLGAENLVFLRQIHGDKIITLSRRSDLNVDTKTPFTGDAVITDIKKKFLVIQTADCQPIMIYDPVRQVVANVHSGWQGSLKNIAGSVIKRMNQSFDCRPSDAIVCIGPSLGPCCAEFINYKKEIHKAYWKYGDRLNHFNFWSITADQVAAEGVLRENIFSSNICTKCRTDLFFSYRKETVTGRFASIIGLI
jgi:YfiH family protein